MQKSFKTYIFSSKVILVSIIFGICFVFSTYIHSTLTKEKAIEHSTTISNQVFSSMYQIMRKGWSKEDLELFTNSLEENFKNSDYKINIYRSKSVEDMFGKVKENKKDETLIQILNGEKTKTKFLSDNQVRNILPLKANNECMKCHSNAKEGEVLGVVEVTQDLSGIFYDSRVQYITFFLIILPLFIVITYFLSRYTTNKVTKSLDLFKTRVKSINSVDDFKQFNSKDINLHFKEFNEIIKNVDSMANKLKNVAVDKELLEFEIKLLDKFIITSDVVKDWREYISDLLLEINKIMETYTLMTMFRVGDDQFEVDIFWLGTPKDEMKKVFENHINGIIKESEHFKGMSDFKIKHIIANRSIKLNKIKKEDIEYRSKSLFLESPKIGGIVGIGLQSILANDPVRYIVIDSILTTMANLVGSVKAIHKYTQDLEYYAARDPLTDLFNQRVFNDMMNYEIKRAKSHDYPFALMVIDCDNFKPINDNFGHTFGDKFLQTIADILEEEKRDEDIVARYGGDEFTMILPECDINGAKTVAQRVSKAVEKKKLLAPDNTNVGITISIGICVYPEHSLSQSEMFIIADHMMYEAKDEGKNSIKIPTQEDISFVLKQSQEKSALLISAIENDEIYPYFQPIKPTSGGSDELIIHELLMRIKHEDKIISAYEFIEIAESRGLINKMDLMVIEKAFKQINETNYKGALFINLSPKTLIMGDFINKVNDLVAKYEIDKNIIVFEITERETVKNFSLLEAFVKNLKSEGYKFAIDDFGSGFSSFHYIKKFPIDYLKIDGDFIINLDNDEKDRAFVNSISTLAKELGVQTIAEFVESQDIQNTLEKLDITYCQGYHIGKPSEEFILK